jgi:Fur family ferric uptake transcriptional regulator
MGFIRGSEIFVEKYAPLRDPIELVIKGYHVSLRVEEAAQIMMEKVE